MQMTQAKPFLFTGSQQAIVLFHAFGGSSNDVRLLGHELNQVGYTVYGPVFTGHGGDPREIFDQGGARVWSRDARFALLHLRDSGYTPVAAFGLSMGGLFATELLETEPSLRAGGTFSSPVVSFDDNTVAQGFPKMVSGYCDAQKMSSSDKTSEMDSVCPKIQPCLDELEKYVNDHIANHLDAIHVPFFIAQGSADEVIDRQSGQKLRDRLQSLGKTVDFHLYPGASHVLTCNQARKQLATDVKEFLKQSIGEQNEQG